MRWNKTQSRVVVLAWWLGEEPSSAMCVFMQNHQSWAGSNYTDTDLWLISRYWSPDIISCHDSIGATQSHDRLDNESTPDHPQSPGLGRGDINSNLQVRTNYWARPDLLARLPALDCTGPITPDQHSTIFSISSRPEMRIILTFQDRLNLKRTFSSQ